MNRIAKKALIGALSVLILCIIVYVALVAHAFSGCGFDDGPFHGKLVQPSEISQYAKKFQLNAKQALIIDNRAEKQSPILMLIEKGKPKWAFDTNIGKAGGGSNARIFAIEDITVSKSFFEIELEFIAHWTGGTESGSMTINPDDGSNEFCLSW